MCSRWLLWAAVTWQVTGIDVMWQDCKDERCYKVMGPAKTLDEIKDLCNFFHGTLFSVPDESTMQHIHDIFERETAQDSLAKLYVGANVDSKGVISFLDGSAVEHSLVYDDFSFISKKSEPCIVSRRHQSYKTISWEQQACNLKNVYSVCKHSSPEHGFCYEVRWTDDKQRLRKRVLEPITQFPPTHPKVSGAGVCGTIPYGFVPPSGQWANWGNPPENDKSCKLTSGGQLFYAYNNPIDSSSNVGYQLANSIEMFFVVDTDYKGYWVVVINSVTSEGKGALELRIDSTGLVDKNVRILQVDDEMRSSYVQPCSLKRLNAQDNVWGKDCNEWDVSKGSGTFTWRWNPYRTDGLVLGELPSSDFCLDLALQEMVGLNSIQLGDFMPSTREIEFYEIPLDSALNVCGYKCPDFCKAIDSCGECSNTPGCGWCPGYGCEPIGAKGGCASGWLDMDSDSCCEECTTLNSCDSCIKVKGCGWNRGNQQCTSGNAFTRHLCGIGYEVNDVFAFNALECKVPTMSPTVEPTKAPSKATTTETPTNNPTKYPSEMPSQAPSKEPSQAPSNRPSQAPSQAPSQYPSQYPSETPTKHPSTPYPTWSPTQFPVEQTPAPTYFPVEKMTFLPTRSPTKLPSQAPSEQNPRPADGSLDGDNTTSNLTQSEDGSWIAWGIPLILILLLSCCCCIGAGVAKRRRRKREEEECGRRQSIESATRGYTETNPMHGSNTKRKTNDLVDALVAARKQHDIIHMYTNNPNIAMTISKESECFVKCTRDSGILIDEVSTPGFLGSIFRTVLDGAAGKRSPKVKTDLKVMKRDEWTSHFDPSTSQEYFYNGKLNEVCWDATEVRVKKSGKQDPLRWEFAPDEFDCFEEVLVLLRRDNWVRHKDLHMDYFENRRTKERIWLE